MAVISERFDNLGADGAPVKLGIMGGTFDPIHVGHLAMADQVREGLGLDAVLFMPTGNPVFKKDQHVTDGQVRLEMCRRALVHNPRFDVSPIEVERGGDTFTRDTLKQMRAHYPDNVEFYFIAGSDAAATIGKWRGSAEVAQLAHLAVAVRPGYVIDDETRTSIMAAGDFDMTCIEVTSLDISSSDIRRRIHEGKSARYLVPGPVYAYIRAHGLYKPHADEGAESTVSAINPLSDAFYEQMTDELRTRVSEKRFAHIMGVADTCARLAEEYGVDCATARLAGLLHDWDKVYDNAGIQARVRELDMLDDLDPWVVQHMPQVLHGPTAARALERAYPQIPREILHAIDVHTTAAEHMSPLDKVLYIADAIEPNRQFGRIDELRALVGKASLDELFFATYEYWVFMLFERRKPLHPDTIRIWNAYTARRALAKGR